MGVHRAGSRTGQQAVNAVWRGLITAVDGGEQLWLSAASLSTMAVALLTLELHIPHARSLKDRRQVVRSLKERLGHAFNVSVAELDEAVTWQSATIGVAAVSGSRSYLEGQMQAAERAASRIAAELGAELRDAWWEFCEA